MSNKEQLKDFVEETLYPEMYKRLSAVFPEMSFSKTPKGWQSRLKLDGSEPSTPRRDKTVVNSKCMKRALENGDEKNSLSLIDLYMRINSTDYIGALKGIASALGLTLPEMEDSESYRQYREKLETLERVSSTMSKDLRTPAGSEVLRYLREVRGYDDEFIEFASFGYVSPESADILRRAFAYKVADGTEHNSLPYDVGSVYTLAIPYRAGGNIKGFAFRTIREGVKPKYKDAFLSGRDSKKYHLFGLSGLRLTGNGEKDRDIVVVEGELDALRAQHAGLENVVAASGGIIYPEALSEAKRLGVERVTILFDREDTEEGQQRIREKIVKAIETITASGLRAMVSEYEEGLGKMDTDSFLRDNPVAALSRIVDDAQTGALYLYRKYVNEAVSATEGGEQGQPSDKVVEELKRKTLELVNNQGICSPTDAGTILSLLSENTGGYITVESLRKEAETALLLDNERKQGGELRTALSEAIIKADGGNYQEAIDYLRGKLDKVSRISTEARYRSLFSVPTQEDIVRSFKEKRAGISTPFYFNGEPFSIPSGALTYICAPTSHGKSRLLENLALSVCNNGESGNTLFFTYEEDKVSVYQQLLNIYSSITLTEGNNRRTIEEYYREGKTQFFRSGTLSKFKQKESEFFSLLTTGRLRVFYDAYDSDTLTGAIRYAADREKVKAVFVDYIQLIHKRGSRAQRKDELKDICKDLMTVSVETGIPIVLGAQLNREALSPLEMTVQNIAEASDIEQSANVVLMLWNSVVKPQPKSTAYYSDRARGILSKEAEALRDRGFIIGQEGKMYAILAKNRGGERNIDAVLDFDGNTGTIKSPESEKNNKQRQGSSESLSLFEEV